MDREDTYLPAAFVLLLLGISIFIALQIPELYASLNLGFYHFIGSIILVGFSFLFIALDYFAWSSYEPSTFHSTQDVRTNPNPTPHLNPSPNSTHKHKHKRHDSNVDPPTRQQLQQLKEVLAIKEGSLQFKQRGAGVYLVHYENGKHHWKHLGSWLELRQKLEG